jgi:hypothetical protein
LLGAAASGLSASRIAPLKEGWKDDLGRWKARDLSARRYGEVWAHGILCKPGLLIGATPEGKKTS